MTFALDKFKKASSGAYVFGGGNIWSYADTSGDALATIKASGFFNSITDRLSKYDAIWVAASDDAQLVKVTSATGAATVTVAAA